MRRQLKFGTGPLIGMFLVSALGAVGCVAIALHVARTGELRGLLRLFGVEGSYAFMMLNAVLCVAAGLGLLRRLLGDRTAAAIRADGIETAGIFLTSVVPWRAVDRIHLRSLRVTNKVFYYIKVDCRCPAGANAFHHWLAQRSYGTPARLIDGGEEAAADWVELAEAERLEALRPRAATAARPVAAEPRPAAAPVRGFGRRVV